MVSLTVEYTRCSLSNKQCQHGVQPFELLITDLCLPIRVNIGISTAAYRIPRSSCVSRPLADLGFCGGWQGGGGGGGGGVGGGGAGYSRPNYDLNM